MYNLKPKIKLSSENIIISDPLKIVEILAAFDKIAIECYPGTDYELLKAKLLDKFPNHKLIFVDRYATDKFESQIASDLTDDRVFGRMTHYRIEQFYDISELELDDQKVIYYGFGASLLTTDILVYADLARWEIQKRFRAGLSNWNISNSSEEDLKKYKRGFFFEWRMADRQKKACLNQIDYFLDLTDEHAPPKLIEGSSIRAGLEQICKRPFRLVPFFDPAVWGGTWMEEHCNLEPSELNYGWSFDGVPEENSLLLQFGNEHIELPAITLVKYQPKGLLGSRTYHRFGDEFPIRFDFLDTIDGGNLSLQVHPLVEYIQEQFNMNYTQDESYYILDADESSDPHVYLGFKNNIDPDRFINDLEAAATGTTSFEAERYINKISVKKGDHILIPAGTIHCSGRGTMVLEISATPYIFTFKLWDWNRLGLDGLPRPTHIEHGKQVLNYECDTDFVNRELVNAFEQLSTVETKTGLHPTQFIETRRFETDQPIVHQTCGEFQMLNLVDGQSICISSPNGLFDDYTINYAETFIIPAGVDEYIISPVSGSVTYIKAYVR